MQTKRNIFIAFIIGICVILAGIGYGFRDELVGIAGFSKVALSYYGSRGEEVINIQAKLYKWGFYSDVVDGIYGYKTYKAVRLFQAKNGIAVDGVAGPDTLLRLGLATGGTVSRGSDTYNRDIHLLAHLINGEARGEPYAGMVAVASVVMNRTRDSRFPKTIAGVIYQPGAFEAVSDGQINLDPQSDSYKAARDAFNGWDPSSGAVYYFNPQTATNKWIWSKTIIKMIGKHYFCK